MFKFQQISTQSFFLGKWNNEDFFLEEGHLSKRIGENAIWQSSDLGGYYFVYNPAVLISGTDPITLFNPDGSKKGSIDHLSLFYSSSCEKILVDNIELENRRLSLFDVNRQAVEWTIDFKRGSIYMLYDDVFYSTSFRNKKLLHSFSVSTGKLKWKFNIEEILSIKQCDLLRVIGVSKDQLIIACSSHLLISVDIYTGEIIDKWQELKGFEVGQFYKDVLPDPTNFVLDEAANKLIGIFHTYYFEIDLITKQISYENLESELKNHSIIAFRPMGNNPFTNDHLFLIAHVRDKEMSDVDLNCVLALNRHTRKVDWHYTFKDTSIGTNVPQITDTNLYLRDAENNLYIFEKQ